MVSAYGLYIILCSKACAVVHRYIVSCFFGLFVLVFSSFWALQQSFSQTCDLLTCVLNRCEGILNDCDLSWGLVTLYLLTCVLNRCEGILNDCDLFWGLVTLYLVTCVLNRCEGILNDCVICPEDWWPYTVRLTGRWNLTGKACRTRVSDCTLAQPRRDAHWRKAVDQRHSSAFVTFGAPPGGIWRFACCVLASTFKKKGRWLVALRWGASGDW